MEDDWQQSDRTNGENCDRAEERGSGAARLEVKLAITEKRELPRRTRDEMEEKISLFRERIFLVMELVNYSDSSITAPISSLLSSSPSVPLSLSIPCCQRERDGLSR